MKKRHTIRTEDGRASVELTPARAIKYKCMDCSCWQRKEMKECRVPLCPLYPYRGWINAPVDLSEAKRQALRARALNSRFLRKSSEKNTDEPDA